jgi:signal transduction histidine kinase
MRGVNREPTLRFALIAGFGLPLGLWLFLGYQATRTLAEAQREAVALDARYVRAQESLSEIRSGVLLASVIVRDALLNLTPRQADSHRQAIENAYQAIDLTLARYVPVSGSPEEEQWLRGLKDEVAAFRRASAEILATDSSTWQTQGGALLRRFLPSRERAVTVSEEAQSVNRALYVEQRRVTAANQAALQAQIWRGLGVALAFSLVMAWLSFRYATRLERKLKEQYAKEAQISADLQKLSAHLIDMQEETERGIARELHDEVGQGLSAVQLELTVAQKHLERTGVAPDLLDDARAATDGVLRNVRNLSQLLHPSVLDDLGLSAAIESYVGSFSRRTGLVVDLVDRTSPGRISADAERAVYRVVQEALNNVHKHARASQVVITLAHRDGTLKMVVDDDGGGFDAVDAERPGARSGLGLLSIRERVTQLDGNLRLESVIGRGTRLEVSVPLLPETPEAIVPLPTESSLAVREV